MGNPVIEDRLRAARPEAAIVDEDAFDADLLAQVQRLPVERRRRSPRRIAVPLGDGGRDARRGRGAHVRRRTG